MVTKSITQRVNFNATPNQVYNLLLNEKLYEAFSGSEVTIDPSVGGEFSVFDGYCTGINIELEEGKKIVQKWNFLEDGWPADNFSICTFIFEPTEKGTKLLFTQTEIPAHKAEALELGR